MTAYRGMDIEISRSEGTQSILMGANGIGASAFGGKGRMPVSDAPAQMLNFAVGDGLSGIVNLEKSSSASDAADAINKSLKNMGIEATARLRVELSDLSANGNVSFMLEANNATPIKISAEVNSGDLSNLATAINDQSARLGITAQLSTNRKRVILKAIQGGIFSFLTIAPNRPRLKAALFMMMAVQPQIPCGLAALITHLIMPAIQVWLRLIR